MGAWSWAVIFVGALIMTMPFAWVMGSISEDDQ